MQANEIKSIVKNRLKNKDIEFTYSHQVIIQGSNDRINRLSALVKNKPESEFAIVFNEDDNKEDILKSIDHMIAYLTINS